MKRRLLSLVLAFVMVIGLLPITALAASTPVYLYTLIPGVVQGSGNSADDEWNGMGVGTITGYDLSNYKSGDTVSSDPDSIADKISFPSSFPDITVNGTNYKYAVFGSEDANRQGFYTIEWAHLVVSGGANAGNNGYNPTVSWSTNTFHLDGQLILNETNYHTVSFALKDVGSSNFVVQTDYSVRVADGYSESNLTVPSFYNKYVDGIEYVFDGWYTDTSCTTTATFDGTIKQNTTYYAKYNPTYTVTYTDGEMNGASFNTQVTSGLLYGVATPSFRGGTPEDPSGAKVFDGWSPAVAATVTDDATYVAQWKDKTYTVTWLDSDGTQLEVDSVVNGVTAAYDNSLNKGTTEQLAAAKSTAEYTYTFAGWTPDVTAVNGTDQIYRATYTTQTNTYTVTWKDSNGTVLETDGSVPYGTVPEYNGGENGQNTTDALAKAKSDADPTAHYTFAGWTPTVTEVTGNQTYTATYSKETEHYTIKWMNYGTNKVFDSDSEVPYDSAPKDYAPSGTPERTGDSTYEYVFVGWTLQGDSNAKNIYYVTKNNSVNIDSSYTYLSIENAPNVVADQVYDAFYVAVERTYTGTVRFTLDNVATEPSKFIGAFTKLQLKGDDGNWYDLTGATVNEEYVYQNTKLPQYTEFEVYADNRSLEHSFEIVQTDNTMTIRYYSVSYDANGGTLAGATTEYYHAGETVIAQAAPTLTGKQFLGWDGDKDSAFNVNNADDVTAGGIVTSGIQKAYEMTAVWEDTVDVVINVHVDHTAVSGETTTTDPDIADSLNITLTHSAGNGSVDTGLNTLNYLEMVDPPKVSIAISEWYTKEDAESTTYKYEGYRDLSKADAYSANVTLKDYKLDLNAEGTDGTGKKVTKTETGYTVDVYLKWDQQGYDLPISVEMRYIKGTETAVPAVLYPKAIDFKILYSAGNSSWTNISEHTYSSMDVNIGSNGTGATSYHVWKSEGNTTYNYNVQILDIDVDGTTAGTKAASAINISPYDYQAAQYFLEIDVQAGTNGQEIIIYVDVESYTVTFDPNGGTWSDDSTGNKVLTQQTVAPNVAQYVPSNGNSAFTGYTWYEDKGAIGTFERGTDTPVDAPAAGEALNKDYILVANWLAPLTVKGNITVDPSNTYGDATYPTKVTVELRKYNGTETAFVTSKTVNVTKTVDGDNVTYTASYEFAPQPADLDYRVLVRIVDYKQEFSNEGSTAMSGYAEGNYKASDNLIENSAEGTLSYTSGKDNIARVDIKLTYQKTAEFKLLYEVDTTAIGEGVDENNIPFRPTKVKTRPWYYNGQTLAELGSAEAWENALKNIQNWASTIPVENMVNQASLELDEDGKVDGITQGYHMVEPYRPNGNAYNYAVYLYSANDIVLSTNRDSVNYTVSYIAPAYFVESTGMQDEMLKIILTPKKFDIIYMDGDTKLHTTTDGHTWSHVTNLKNKGAWKYVPAKSGYVFDGWYTDAALTTPAEDIAANIAAKTTLYAKWNVDNWADAQADDNDNITADSLTGGDGIPDSQQIYIRYTADANGSVSLVGEIVTISGTKISAPAGSTATANAGYAFDEWSRTDGEAADAFTFVNAAKLVLTKGNSVVGGKTYTFQAAFDTDGKGDPTGGGDGIPDKYQLFIEYYSANTAWGSVREKNGDVKQPVCVTINAAEGAEDIKVEAENLKEIETVPAANHTFDRWTQNDCTGTVNPVSVLTDKTFAGGTTIKFYAHFAIDEWSDEKDSVTEGDNIPDYKQALVRFVATTNGRGTVTGAGTVQVFTFKENNGSYGGNITPVKTDVAVTPKVTSEEKFAFDYWGDTDNFWKQGHGVAFKNKEKKNDPFVEHVGVIGGQIIVYTAHFSADVWNGGDEIPDHRQILINYVPDNANHGIVTPSTEVIALNDQTSVTATGSTAAANEGYVFEGWSFQQRSTVEYEPTATTIKPVINGAVGGEVYTFTANFAKDANNDDISDKYQATVKYVSSDTTQGTVTVASEIVTVRNSSGDPDYAGTAITSATGSTAQPKTGYVFDEWSNTHGISLGEKKTNANLAEVSFIAEAEKEYTFTANFAAENAAISVAKELADGQTAQVDVGETIVWTITVENKGNVKLTGIKLTDSLVNAEGTSALVYENASDTTALDLSAYTFELEAGESKSFTAKYVVQKEDAGRNICNTAVAKVDEITQGQDTTEPVVVKNPGLNVTKTVNDNKTTANVGETIIWTVTVENTGNVPLTNISLTDTLYANGSAVSNLDLKDSAGNTVSKIDSLAPNDPPVVLTATYKVTAADVGKTLKNVATATTPNDGPEDDGESGETKIPDPYIPPVNPDPPKLNKEDHFAYIIGKDDGLVHPLDQITRAETATIFFRMLLEESRQAYWTQENNFVDVKITDWFNNAASTLNNAGIMTGRPGGQFAPYANITRGEFATLAVRFFLDEDVEITENNLADVKGHWAEANINLAYALGLITGYPDDTFKPDQEITRAEAMVIVNRVLERHPDKDHLLNNMITWPDNMDPNVWYYADVQEATNSHLYVLMTDEKGEKYEIWQQLLPVRDWAALEKEWSEYNSSHNPGEVVDVTK